MKLLQSAIFCLFAFTFISRAQNEFTTVWDLSLPGPSSNQIAFYADIDAGGAQYEWETIPAGSSGTGTIAAGDVNTLRVINGLPANATIRLKIQPDPLNHFRMIFSSTHKRLVDVENWGNSQWTSMIGAFQDRCKTTSVINTLLFSKLALLFDAFLIVFCIFRHEKGTKTRLCRLHGRKTQNQTRFF